jgi:lipoate-protein ligase B
MDACLVRVLGLVPYQSAWDLQVQLAGQIATGEIPATLLLLEHPHTFTFGRSGNSSNLLWNDDQLKQRGIEVHWVDRGGDVTYHGPGQLVGYPLIPLNINGLIKPHKSSVDAFPRADYLGYLRRLETVLILALHQFGVKAVRLNNLTGVWVNGSKIAAIGVKVDSHGITRHGFSLNVTPDLSYWEGIIGCGLVGYPVTSMACLLTPTPPMQQVSQAIVSAFEQVFDVECRMIT